LGSGVQISNLAGESNGDSGNESTPNLKFERPTPVSPHANHANQFERNKSIQNASLTFFHSRDSRAIQIDAETTRLRRLRHRLTNSDPLPLTISIWQIFPKMPNPQPLWRPITGSVRNGLCLERYCAQPARTSGHFQIRPPAAEQAFGVQLLCFRVWPNNWIGKISENSYGFARSFRCACWVSCCGGPLACVLGRHRLQNWNSLRPEPLQKFSNEIIQAVKLLRQDRYEIGPERESHRDSWCLL
jgi:hypothetical protein